MLFFLFFIIKSLLLLSKFFESGYISEFIPNGASADETNNTVLPPTSRTRSVEETEAAHDLLSLSQSLPPLPAPGAVSIQQSAKAEEPATISYTYSPLAPEAAATFQTTTQLPVTIPCYQPPIVYVVQVNALPTPPTSECSSDAENQSVRNNYF